MMNINTGDNAFKEYCELYLVSKIYKIKPLKEEGKEWESYLDSFIQELIGASVLVSNRHYFGLVSKLQGLKTVSDDKLFRKIWLECINYAKSLPDKMGDNNELV